MLLTDSAIASGKRGGKSDRGKSLLLPKQRIGTLLFISRKHLLRPNISKVGGCRASCGGPVEARKLLSRTAPFSINVPQRWERRKMLDLLPIMPVLQSDEWASKPGPRKLNGQIEPSVRLVIWSLTTLIVGGTLQFGN